MTIVLGIDIGSTSCKADLLKCQKELNFNPNFRLDSVSLNYQFSKNDLGSSRFEQSVDVIFQTLDQCLLKLDSKLLEDVQCIGICGQMHGCLLWKRDDPSFCNYDASRKSFNLNSNLMTNLISWQDDRCDEGFLSTLPKPSSNAKIGSGFGMATIFWLLKNKSELVDHFDRSGTIMDFIVSIICDLEYPVQSIQNAYGYGYFDLFDRTWNISKLKESGFPLKLLPKVVDTGCIAGRLKNQWHSIKPNIPVFAAFGDLQCHVYSCLAINSRAVVLNISTSIQMSMMIPNGRSFQSNEHLTNNCATPNTVECIPYFDRHYLAVSASLNGGNVLDSFVKYLKHLVYSLTDIELKDDHIWTKLTHLMKDDLDDSSTFLHFDATLFGERFRPELKASLSNITSNLSLKELFYSINQGIIDNIFKMMPVEWIVEQKVDQLIGVGNALIKNPFLQKALRSKLKPLNLKTDFTNLDAACGAALAAFSYFHN